MVLKVGDVVRIKKPENKMESPVWADEMDKYDGKTVTISDITRSGNFISRQTDVFHFNPKWATLVSETSNVLEASW